MYKVLGLLFVVYKIKHEQIEYSHQIPLY